jgi:hypothetical protein
MWKSAFEIWNGKASRFVERLLAKYLKVERTLPPNVGFYVCIAPEGEYVPSREELTTPKSSPSL